MFELKNVTKTFGGEVALSGVSLTIAGGMNYIVGASGSGKSTLLRILAAMDTEYEGEALYCGESLKALTAGEKARLYGEELGFIAQDSPLIEELSVRENILIPALLGAEDGERRLKMLLKKLGIEKIEHQKASTLSGGQKQRVAIARELMKDPAVLIADEPTAALDAGAAKEVAALLRSIAKERTVVVVTHDTSLIQGKCSVFELDKGVLCRSKTEAVAEKRCCRPARGSGLSLESALRVAVTVLGRQWGKALSLVLAMAVAASCLALDFSGILDNSSKEAFERLVAEQGNAVMNLDIVPSFMNAAGTDDDLGSREVEQDIGGLMERYQDDRRVEGITMISPIDDAVATLDGKDFIIECSGQAPVFNKLVAGKNADNGKNEVVLPEVLVKKMGLSNEEIIGKELSFLASVYNWDSGEPVEMPVSFKATVSGVADTSYVVEFEGQSETFAHEDSLFLSLAIMKDIYRQAKIENPSFSFTIRPSSPEDYLELYDELMSQGIVPLGQVELIRDIVSLKGSATSQMGVSSVIIAVLSLLAAASVCFVVFLMRRKEYAIYKLSGYTGVDLAKLTLAEYGLMLVGSSVLCAVAALILHVPVWFGIALGLCVALVCFAESSALVARVVPMAALKTGER